MYVRFIVCEPGILPARGIFRTDFEQDEPTPDWLDPLLGEHYAWFNAYLPIPSRLTVKSRGRRLCLGLCWFRPEAREHIRRARELASLLGETGAITAQLQTHQPGQILYRDEFQIVAKPEPGTPLAA